MSDLAISRYLDSIFNMAKKGNDTDIVTVDAVLMVMAKLVMEMPEAEVSGEQIRMRKIISSRISPELLFNELQTAVKKQKPSFIDSINYQKVLKKALEDSEKKQKQEIGADVFAACILESPSSIIKGVLKDDAKEEKKSAEESNESKSSESEKTSDEKTPVKEKGNGKIDYDKMTSSERVKSLESIVQKTKEISKVLSEKIYGQNNAIATFASGYFQSLIQKLTAAKRNAPAATFLFAGPPGVGKTFLAESVASVLDIPYKRFDMSEYSDKEANLMFCGMDNSYKNSAPGHVTSFVKDNPECIILFDEIEKSHTNIIHLFLQILDAGRVKDNFLAEEVYFNDAIIIFTTNAGRSLYDESDTTDFSDLPRKVILNALKKDINPETGAPFFPGAICSRFATGNVVMFNHMDISTLSTVVRGEMSRNIKDIEKRLDVKISIDDNIYTALLFAEGSGIDARTARSRAQSFLERELFELLRLMTSEKGSKVTELRNINILMDIRKEQTEIYETFNMCEKPNVLVFAQPEVESKIEKIKDFCNPIVTDDIAEMKVLIEEKEIAFVLLDFTLNTRAVDRNYLNIEDTDSSGRDCMMFLRGEHPSIPIYILDCGGHEYTQEEKVTFLHHGIRDIFDMEDTFAGKINDVCKALYSQQKMLSMTSRGKVLTFETAQQLKKTENGVEADIILFDLKTVTAIDSEDKSDILSNMTRPDIRFDDVIGAEDVKDELKYFAEYLKNPKKYAGTGLRAPRGILLYGPPGTGKTLMAKALAGESDTTFISAEGNQFLKKYIGEGPETVHKMFRIARKYAPSQHFLRKWMALKVIRTSRYLYLRLLTMMLTRTAKDV